MKAKICISDGGQVDADCLKKGSNWTLTYVFNAAASFCVASNFILIAIGACSAVVRSIAGIMFCVTGLIYLYGIYQTFQHRLIDDHFSGLCELNLNTSYHESGLLEEFSNVPKTYAEDAQLLLAFLIYQVSFIPLCLCVGALPMFRFKPKKTP